MNAMLVPVQNNKEYINSNLFVYKVHYISRCGDRFPFNRNDPTINLFLCHSLRQFSGSMSRNERSLHHKAKGQSK